MKRKKRIAIGMTVLLLMSLCVQGCGKKMEDTMGNHEITVFGSRVKAFAKEEFAKQDLKEQTHQETTSQEKISEEKNSQGKTPEKKTSEKKTPEKKGSVSSGIASPATSGALHVEGTQLMDSNGSAVQLRGISTHGIAWFPDYVNEDCFRQFREEWDANVVRLAMYTAENGGYCTGGDKDYLKRLVKSGVEYATAQDMYVIIDWHILSDNNPNTYIGEAKAFFTEMAQEYAGYDNVLYEICNEPNGGTSWGEVKSYAEEVIGIIRSYDEDGIIIVGTPNWCQFVDQAAANPITGYDNIMYALHFYAATHTDSLRNTMTAAIDAGLPIFVSEYGICDASGNGGINEGQANQWVDTMNAYGVSYVAWNLSNKNETSAIISSNCSKTSGFTDSDLSASGKWLYHMLTGNSGMGNGGSSQQTNNGSDRGNSNAGQNQNNSSQAGQGNSATGNTSQNNNTPAVSLSNGELAYTAELKNSWESEGKVCYQYELILQNTSSSDCGKWSIDLSFNEELSFMDGWNGDYSASGKTLHIACKDYNGSIPAGGSIKDIGFIISGSKELQVTE